MKNNGIVNIHGKDYMTVAGRLGLAHAEGNLIEVITEVVQNEPVVVIKAKLIIKGKGIFTGISSANPAKAIEASNPYEVAETSAVGRALGFAGYGVIEGIASADEMAKSQEQTAVTEASGDTPVKTEEPPLLDDEGFTREPVGVKKCSHHDVVMTKGFSQVKKKDYWYHDFEGKRCFGYGYQ